MNNPEFNENLHREVKKFRDAIIQSKVWDRPLKFPKGYCKIASLILAKYLIEKRNFKPSLMFCVLTGEKANYKNNAFAEQTHAWLEYQEFTIDITANQFPEIVEEIVITTGWIWGEKFCKGVEKIPIKEMLDLGPHVIEIYDKVLATLESSQ